MRKQNPDLSELTAALMKYLDCPCRSFSPMADDAPIMEAYLEARERGKKDGFHPMLVVVDDILLECLMRNADWDSDGDIDQFVAGKVVAYRKKMLAAPLAEGEEIAGLLFRDRREEMESALEIWDTETFGEISGGFSMDRLGGYWDFITKETYPLILAEIPVKNPWEVFAWLPFGGWNECPNTPELMAITKYWYSLYGAVPVVVTHDVLELAVPAPVGIEAAKRLALEQYCFCADIVEQGPEDGSPGMLADTLAKSNNWYFWWD